MSNTIRCKLTGEPIATKLDGGWCVCPGRCLLVQQAERAIDDEVRTIGEPRQWDGEIKAGMTPQNTSSLRDAR